MGLTLGVEGGTPLKAGRGEVVSPATGRLAEEPRGLRINQLAPVGGLGGQGTAPVPPPLPPCCGVGHPYLGFWRLLDQQWGPEVGP